MWKNIRRFQPKPNTQSKRIDMFHRNNKVLSPIETSASYEAPPAITYTSDKVIAQLIIDKIIEKNGKGSNIYGVTGAATYYANDIIQNAVNSGDLNYIHASNESAGVYMAAYEAEINGTVGIHFCTAGPGTAMATTAIGSLFNETKPCIIFFGVPTNNFQYIDQQIMSCITKKVIYINSNTINPEGLLDDAFSIAKNGTSEFPGQGPVAVFINNGIWLQTYSYTNNVENYVKNIDSQSIITMLNNIFSYINSSTLVILRVGERVDINNIKLLAELTKIYTNIYLHLTYVSKTYVDSTLYTNVGIEGPMGNAIVNDNYNSASIVIDIANDINYSLIVYSDVYNLMSANAKIFYCLDQDMTYKPSSSNNTNTITTDPNIFVSTLINLITSKISLPINTSWTNTKTDQNTYFGTVLTNYITQTNDGNDILTTASIIAQIIDKIYSLQTYNIESNADKIYLISDNTLYSSDVGACSFIFDSLVIHDKQNYNLNFGEFSPIGCSLATCAGRMRTTLYDDLVCVIGDGGWLNVPGYIIDLKNVMCENPEKRCLFILVNDCRYSNVALGEKTLFGYFTDVTSTYDIQKNIDCYSIIQNILGTKCIQSLFLENITSVSIDLANFVENWYTKTNDFSAGGFYFIYYKTTTGTPIIIDA